jgi:hypothetical protein
VGVSYVSIFVVCYHITFWVFGAANALSWDYLPGVPQKDEAERRVPWSQKPIGGWVHRVILRRPVESVWAAQTQEAPAQDDVEMAVAPHTTVDDGAETPGMITGITEVSRQVSRTSHISEKAQTSPATPFTSARRLDIIRRVLRPLKAAANSITITLVCSLIIAVVNDLKALFVDISSQGGPSWHGPDGRPPLSFVIDTGASHLLCARRAVLTYLSSVFHWWHHSSPRTNPTRRILRTPAHSATPLAPSVRRHVLCGACQDGNHPRRRRIDRASDDPWRTDGPKCACRAIRCHVPRRHASISEVSRSSILS